MVRQTSYFQINIELLEHLLKTKVMLADQEARMMLRKTKNNELSSQHHHHHHTQHHHHHHHHHHKHHQHGEPDESVVVRGPPPVPNLNVWILCQCRLVAGWPSCFGPESGAASPDWPAGPGKVWSLGRIPTILPPPPSPSPLALCSARSNSCWLARVNIWTGNTGVRKYF